MAKTHGRAHQLRNEIMRYGYRVGEPKPVDEGYEVSSINQTSARPYQLTGRGGGIEAALENLLSNVREVEEDDALEA